MRRLVVVLTATTLVLLIGTSSAVANSDPHRFPLPSAPFDLDTSYCPFPVHVAFPVDHGYASVTASSDGSTVYRVTGSLFARITNLTSGRSIVVNASGPGIFTFRPDGATVIGSFHGRVLLYAPNLTEHGFPSNVVAVAGPMVVTQLWAADGTFTFTDVAGHPQLITDVCGALS
jgi:hypothetical protein